MTARLTTILLTAAIALSCAAACTGTLLDDEDGGKMTLTKYCKQTECERERKQCLDRTHSRCDYCYDTCGDIIIMDGDTSCLETCDDVCDTVNCGLGSCDSNACAEQGFKFDLPEPRDEAFYEACGRFVEWYASCGMLVLLDCDKVARVYRTEAAASFECESNLACGADTDSCWPEPSEAGTLGHEACSRFDLMCGAGSCDEDWRDAMNQSQAELREDVVDALRLCFEESSCHDLTSCIDAWVEAVLGPP